MSTSPSVLTLWRQRTYVSLCLPLAVLRLRHVLFTCQIKVPEELVGFIPSAAASAKMSCGKWAFVSRAVALAEKLSKSAVDEARPVFRDPYSVADSADAGSGGGLQQFVAALSKPTEARVHVDTRGELATETLAELDFALLLDGQATDALASKAAGVRKRGITKPFPFVDLHDFLPPWCAATRNLVVGDDGDLSLTTYAKRAPPTFLQWQVAYDRYTMAAVACKLWSYKTALAHRNVVSRVCFRFSVCTCARASMCFSSAGCG